MTLQEVLGKLNFEGSYEEQCRQYAELLDSGYVLGFYPEELIGNDTSSDGVWKWSKRTAFINKYKNNVAFNEALCIFENPLPDGVFIINEHFDYTSLREDCYRIVARIAGKKFVDVRASYEYHKIYSAKEVSRKQIDREISQLVIRSTAKYCEPFLDMYETEDNKNSTTRTNSYILTLLKYYRGYINTRNDEHSKRKEDLDFLLFLVFGFSTEEVKWFAAKWEEDWDHEERWRIMESGENSI